ncbi:hypothetical protein AX16_008861 [Volvariella volvacea WC 439]|nr:hypothetical protein AX16_008861 [Volvariella volvacea WC 439]
MFTSNGLLAPQTTSLPTDTPELTPESVKFTLNDLLGPSTNTSSFITESLPKYQESQSYENELSTQANEFGSSSNGTSFRTSMSSQNDSLPSVTEAFGLPSYLLQSTPSCFITGTSIGNAGSSYTPRTNLRATTFEGKPVFMKRKPKKLAGTQTAATAPPPAMKMSNLLDIPMHRMMEELSIHKKRNDTEKHKTTRAQDFSDANDTLWVDRYRPRKFTELIGNERVARDTMTWVKQWDWCVFGKNKTKKRLRDADNESGWLADQNDPYHRPRERILLISGPPGLGKTSLVHVIARHAGYEVMEINASDARTGQIVDERIRPALEAGSTVGGTRPVLLVIDEIDGATGVGENANSFIHKLVQLATEKAAKKKKTKNGKSDGKRPILRPIICICNDVNASSLAKLRPHSFQVRMQRPADVFVVKRLREICEVEGLKAEARALNTLVGVARGDLRGCLNTLQFIKCKGQSVTEPMIRRATVGMKEGDISVLSVLNDLFAPLSKKRVQELGLTDEEEAKYVARLSHAIDGSGRDMSLAIGCFEHYATLRRHDATFRRYERANEWLGTYDLLSSAMYLEGDFSLNQYLPYALVPFYPLFQERGAKVERSHTDWEHQKITQGNQEIYHSLARGLRAASLRNAGAYRNFINQPILQLEFAPLINRIMSPPLRPVGNRLVKAEDRILLNRLVAIMVALELRFVQERADDGQLVYRLDPPIDVFVTYDGKRASDIAVSRYAVRHLVAGEVDGMLAAQQADVIEKGKRGKHESLGQRGGGAGDDLEAESESKRRKIEELVEKPPTDFFGRPIKPVSSSASTKPLSKRASTMMTPSTGTAPLDASKPKSKVVFKYAEGNSAAVRKPIKVNAFL